MEFEDIQKKTKSGVRYSVGKMKLQNPSIINANNVVIINNLSEAGHNKHESDLNAYSDIIWQINQQQPEHRILNITRDNYRDLANSRDGS